MLSMTSAMRSETLPAVQATRPYRCRSMFNLQTLFCKSSLLAIYFTDPVRARSRIARSECIAPLWPKLS